MKCSSICWQQTEFLWQFTDWVETWSASPYFTHALIPTLRAAFSLILDSLTESYNYVLRNT